MITLSKETNEVLEHLNDVIIFKNKISSFSEGKGFRGDEKFQNFFNEVKVYADFVTELLKKEIRIELESLNEAS